MKKLQFVLHALVLCWSCTEAPKEPVVWKSIEKDLQAQFIMAQDGDVIELNLFSQNIILESVPTNSDSGANLLLRDSSTGNIEKLGIGTGLTVSGGNLNAGGGGSSRPMSITLHSNATANITLTNQPNSEQFLSNSSRNVRLVDFTGYDSVKISFRTITGSASVNSPRIKLEYATSFGSVLSDYTEIGASSTEVSAAISTTNDLTDSGWIALTAAAKAEIYIALMQDGGDGVEDPAIATITVTVK